MGARERFVALFEKKVGTYHGAQKDLADRLGENKQWVNNRLRGEVSLQADDIPRLADALGVHCMDFFVDSDCAETRLARQPSAASPDFLLPSGERPTIAMTITRNLAQEFQSPEGRRIAVALQALVGALLEEPPGQEQE